MKRLYAWVGLTSLLLICAGVWVGNEYFREKLTALQASGVFTPKSPAPDTTLLVKPLINNGIGKQDPVVGPILPTANAQPELKEPGQEPRSSVPSASAAPEPTTASGPASDVTAEQTPREPRAPQTSEPESAPMPDAVKHLARERIARKDAEWASKHPNPQELLEPAP